MAAIGIDFGATYCCVAVCQDGKVEIIPNEHDKRITPSYIAFTEDERVFGDAAKHQAPLNLKNTIPDIKQFLGLTRDDIAEQKIISDVDIVPGDIENKPYFSITHRDRPAKLCAEQIAAMILNNMKQIAENYLGIEVKHAVLSVPTNYTNAQRKSIYNAGLIAGFSGIKLINDSTAAAVAYGIDREKEGTRLALIFDLGGGSLNISVVKICGTNFEVVSAAGDSNIGGDNIDDILVKYYLETFQKTELDRIKKKATCRLRTACEKAKRALSASKRTRLQVDMLLDDKPFNATLTRDKFEDINGVFFEKTMEVVEMALQHGNLEKEQIDEIVLVGGSSRIPKIRQKLQEYFEGKELIRTINPDEAVAYGAAVHAVAKEIENYKLTDISGRPIGGIGGEVIIERNAKIPVEEKIIQLPANLDKNKLEIFDGGDSTRNIVQIEQLHAKTSGRDFLEVSYKMGENGIFTIKSMESEIDLCHNKAILGDEDIKIMIEENNKFNYEDNEVQEDNNARNELEKYAYDIQSIVKAKYISVMEKEDIDRITAACVEVIDWILRNKESRKEETETKMNELRNIF